ncbi:hypothetical protein PMIN01_12040 [Paraphaeosphaeria minitans]|uniref:Uncharacterized protein n=1 Tax=Paraphaeosphaeria minitans TaxID=565426 RepID=A0A9P6G4T2_9PLEO|nr:hypothetical protein PMIN01_13331 [Paraphaeosphaeria minitans]KAF9728562.1 hypothetical protein PMIN01_13390 [Paraphaeosphaeria minitans]KAF9730107.1 hypothetical protein PMIN01_12040 [Paraphaeosphaeria minitans]
MSRRLQTKLVVQDMLYAMSIITS